MAKKEFHVFKRNTDAIATNRGFYYQYLVTIKLWLDNFTQEIDNEIYCEREDDIFQFNNQSQKYTFHQVKCYAEGTGLNSPEIKSSLLNFYNLYLKYKGKYKGLFYFETNAEFKPRAGKTLKQWAAKQQKGDYSPTEFVKETRTLLIKEIDNKLSKYELQETDIQKLTAAKQKVVVFKQQIQTIDFVDFLKAIRWNIRGEKDTTKAVLSISKEIKSSLISNKIQFDKAINSNLFLGYLLNTVVEKSIEQDETKRLLNNDLLQRIINSTDLKIKIAERLRPDIMQLMNNDFQIMEVLENVEEIAVDTNQKVTEMYDAFSKTEQSKNTTLVNLTAEVSNWFKVLGYGFEKHEKTNGHYSELIINIPKRRKGYERIFVLCVSEVVELNYFHDLEENVTKHNCDEGWVITYRRISKSVRKKAKNCENLFCYTVDELLDEDTNFEGYFKWLEKEVTSRNIQTNYIPLYCKKDVFDPSRRTKLDTNQYTVNEYIDQWLDDPAKKHISILGEFGTGKTWFTLHYAWTKLQEYKTAKKKGLSRPRIPILIPLRDFSKALTIEGVFSEFFFRKHNSPIRNYDAFLELNKMGKLLLIFDGFDEMADRVDKQKMVNNFWELAKAITENAKVILTCRNEHFPEATRGRELLNAELKASVQHLNPVEPQFEVLDLLMFNNEQIKELFKLYSDEKTVQKIVKNPILLDLARRPIMTELILEALPDIEAGKPIDISRIYLYATQKKLAKDITEKRTFTSIADKLYFMCELSWEMLSTSNMSLNYRAFPDRIRTLFGATVTEQKDLDHWHYDMMGQTMLIRNDDGDYKPAHRSLLEFFVAYKFAAELGILDDDFIDFAKTSKNGKAAQDYEWKDYFEHSSTSVLAKFKQVSLSRLVTTFGKELLPKAVMELLIEMISIESSRTQKILLELLDETRYKEESEVRHISNNIILLLVEYQYDYFKGRDLSNLCMKNFTIYEEERWDIESLAYLEGTDFTNTDLENADLGGVVEFSPDKFMFSNFNKTSFRNTVLTKFDFNSMELIDFDLNEKYNLIAVCSFYGSTVLIDLKTFNLITKNITEEEGNIKFSSNGKELYLNSGLYFSSYDINSLSKIQKVKIEKSSIQYITKITRGNIFITGKKCVHCLDLNTFEILYTLPFSTPNSIPRILNTMTEKGFKSIDLSTLLDILEASTSLSINRNQKYLAISGLGYYIVWDLFTKTIIINSDKFKEILSKTITIKFHEHYDILAILKTDYLDFIDISTKESIWKINVKNIIVFDFFENGNKIVIVNDIEFLIYDFLGKIFLKSIPFHKFLGKADSESSSRFRIQKIIIDDKGENIYFLGLNYIYCLNIKDEEITNKYQHMCQYQNADFTNAKGIDKETAIQLQKNGAIINVEDYN